MGAMDRESDQELSQPSPPENGSVPMSDQEGDPPALVDEASTSSVRAGTIVSARFNILSTMVGGGSLSLPMAFQKSGNALVGPILLLLVAAITEFCFRVLIASARTLSPASVNESRRGKDSFETIASAAFGKNAYLVSTVLVTAMCFFGTVGYAVLLRDMLQPIAHAVFSTSGSGPNWANNTIMFAVVLFVTPLCTLKTLTSLKRFGAAGMLSVFILGTCIVYRSVECNLGLIHTDDVGSAQFWKSFKLFPDSTHDVLNVFPIFVSCFVCHYNIPTVHNELKNPTPARVGWWLRSTTWGAAAFYMIMGVAGSAYAPCTATGTVHGNVLLDFKDDDPLLLVGRLCLAFTITMAFPMLTIPARDIIIKSMPCSLSTFRKKLAWFWISATRVAAVTESDISPAIDSSLTSGEEPLGQPLLLDDEEEGQAGSPSAAEVSQDHEAPTAPFLVRLGTATAVFWTAAVVASCVTSIDIVWSLLGSSLSILVSYLIPCGSYLVIAGMRRTLNDEPLRGKELWSVIFAWFLIILFIPLSILSTINAIRNTFFSS